MTMEASEKHGIPASHKDLLEKPGFAHLATLGPDGWPQSTPMWYGWDGEHLLFSTLKSRRKHRNLQANPHVAVSIADPDNPYRYVQIRGVATMEDERQGSLINALVQKYMGEAVYRWDDPEAERVIVRVSIERSSCFG
jgi:PPOX class probable F420-dependent enzyme